MLRRLLPTQCEVCRRWGRQRLCATCVARHAPAVPRCARCGLRTGQALAECGACLHDPPPFAQTVCAVDYAFPWDRLIAQLKFNDHVELASAMAPLMLAAWRRDEGARPDVIVPVPLSRRRLAERGYNQALVLAQPLARDLGRPLLADALERVTDSVHQVGSTRAQRAANLRAAFMASPRRQAALRDRHVALVDDVVTTGATAAQASSALLRAGAARVDLWALARTPAD